MSDLKQRIADLTTRRAAIYARASGRWLTAAEREQVRLLTQALNSAWDLRRLEQAQQPQIEHELVIVREMGR